MKKANKHLSNKQILLRAVIGLALAAVLLYVAYQLAEKWEHGEEAPIVEQSEQADQNTAALARFVYDGKSYIENSSVSTLLLLGVDKDLESSNGLGKYRNGGQADFVMLLVMDSENKTVRRLQIDRDSVTQVPYLDVLGRDRGTREWYLTLSHNFGETPLENNRNTAQAVKNLFNGAYETLYTEDGTNASALRKLMANPVRIDMCASLYMDGIAELNDALGGVTVEIIDDLSNTDLPYQIGETVTLHGNEAEKYVRTRQKVGEGTNVERMKNRQNAYMASALEKIVTLTRQDANFLSDLYTTLTEGNYLVTDFSLTRLVNELAAALNYEIDPIEYIEGYHTRSTVGDNTYNAFHADAGWLTNWVLSTYYTQR